jgi:CheY-like chemotaxis protein
MQAGQHVTGQPATILVVEDEALVRMLAVDTLEDFGFRVLEAGKAAEALAILSGEPTIDLLLTDVGLPGMDGRTLAAEARQARPGLPVIYMTGYGAKAATEDARTAILGKPFTPDQLHNAIRALLDA